MYNLTSLETEAIMLLTSHGRLKGPMLASLMNIERSEVGRVIRSLRKKFMNGNQNAVYVHLSKSGYTLEETPENLRYEGLKRLKMGTSMILNGRYIFMRYKAISLTDYHQLKISFQPKALNTINMLSDAPDIRRRRITTTPVVNNGYSI